MHEEEVTHINRQQRRYAERQAKKPQVTREGGMRLEIVKTRGEYRIREKNTVNFLRTQQGSIINYPTEEIAYRAMVRLRAWNEANLKKSAEELEEFREKVKEQVAAAKASGATTGLEGTPYDVDPDEYVKEVDE
jgi:hypothetical protein